MRTASWFWQTHSFWRRMSRPAFCSAICRMRRSLCLSLRNSVTREALLILPPAFTALQICSDWRMLSHWTPKSLCTRSLNSRLAFSSRRIKAASISSILWSHLPGSCGGSVTWLKSNSNVEGNEAGGIFMVLVKERSRRADELDMMWLAKSSLLICYEVDKKRWKLAWE